MPAAGGPNTLGESNLVFAYDTGDVSNSYLGEPTVNKAGGVHLGFSGDRWAKRTDYPQKGALPFKLLGDVYQLTSGNNYWGSAGDFSPAYNKTYTLSYWYYLSTDSNLSQWHNSFFGTPQAGGSEYTTVSTKSNDTFSVTGTNTWRYGSVNITTSTPVNSYSYFRGTYTSGGGDNMPTGQIYIANFQLEEKSHATPFTTGTRSATQGLLPLIGNSTIDLSNVSFDSSAKMVFDGTNDYIAAGNPTDYRMGVSDFTLECVMKQSKTTGHCLLETRGNSLAGYLWVHNYYSTGQSCLFLNYGGNQYLYFQDGGFVATTTTQYYHMAIVVNRAGNTISFYVNGNKAGNDVAIHGNSISPTGGDIYRVGFDLGGSPWQGEIPIFKHYNKTLSPQEVKQNYQQYKTRFNLS